MMNLYKYLFLNLILFFIILNWVQPTLYGDDRTDIEKRIYHKKRDLKKLNKIILKKKKEVRAIGKKETLIKKSLRNVKKGIDIKNKKVLEQKLNILKLSQIANANNVILRQLVNKVQEKGKVLNKLLLRRWALDINRPDDFLFSPLYYYLCSNKKRASQLLILNNIHEIGCIGNLISLQTDNKVRLSFQRNLFQDRLTCKEEALYKIKRDYIYQTKGLNDLKNKKIAYNNSINN
ncbi:MAG: hypothetical protein SV062_02910, partial [Thermodesulfobacteriota bacterium]|nr:hypothetical protein [Thermodesulfobacteriota bacterium]